MKKLYLTFAIMAGAMCVPFAANAQLSQNPDKFLGNITTWGNVNTDGIEYASLWNQITPENESKWSTIEGTRGSFNWWGCDACYNYAKEHNFPFKFHCLIWGAQYPRWMDDLNDTPSIQYAEIVKWMDAIKERYPDLEMIDVVNEACPGHQPAPYKNALGGDGYTGYDWIVKAFEMAHERWPEAILIYNDFNTFQWNTNDFINLVKILRDAGAPIDAYGCQSHDLGDISFANFKNVMTNIQNNLKIPMFSTEYDISIANDEQQKRQYADQIKYMWEQDYVGGITLWGYIYGKTWVDHSGIIKDGKDRPAMTWLREYMASDDAKNAKSPFPGMKKEASVYIRPSSPFPGLNVPMEIEVDASLRTKTIEKVELYINNKLEYTLTEAPYIAEYTPAGLGKKALKAIVYDTEGNKYERIGGFKVVPERKPYKGDPITLPGRLQFEDFDICAEGVSFHDSDSKNSGTTEYRTDGEGVDIINGGSGYAIGYTNKGEWLEYTIEITKSARYEYFLNAATPNNDASISITLLKDGILDELVTIDIPNTGSWDTYQEIHDRLPKRLSPGIYTMRVNVGGGSPNLDYIHIGIIGGVEDIEAIEAGSYAVYTTTGMYVGEIDIESERDINAKINSIIGTRGIYLIRNKATGESRMVQTK